MCLSFQKIYCERKSVCNVDDNDNNNNHINSNGSGNAECRMPNASNAGTGYANTYTYMYKICIQAFYIGECRIQIRESLLMLGFFLRSLSLSLPTLIINVFLISTHSDVFADARARSYTHSHRKFANANVSTRNSWQL